MEANKSSFLIMNEEGAVLSSGGELDNDERLAGVIFSLVNTVGKLSLGPTGTVTNFHRITVSYGTHMYMVILSNKRYHVVKRKCLPNEPVVA